MRAFAIVIPLLLTGANAFVGSKYHPFRTDTAHAVEPISENDACTPTASASWHNVAKHAVKASGAAFLVGVLTLSPALAAPGDGGASIGSNAKITTGGASTLQSGRTIAITRGMNLDNSDFSKQHLKGVAFQQSTLLLVS